MNPQVQKALDGDIPEHALTPADRAELARAKSSIDAVLFAVPVQPLPDLAPAVLARIRSDPHRWRAGSKESFPASTRARRIRVTDWMWRSRSTTITWRPAYALAAGLVFVALLAAESLRPRSTGPVARQVFTQFVLSAPSAKGVAVAGDFSDWKPVHVMTRSEAGVWTVVVPLDPGVHDYAFVVDGERWIPDPAAPPVSDGFGGTNSRLAVLSPDRRS